MSNPEIYDIFMAEAPCPATAQYQMFETKTDPTTLSDGNYTQTQNGAIRLLLRDIDNWYLPSEAVLRVLFQIAEPLYSGAPPAPVGSSLTGVASNAAATLVNGGWNLFRDSEIRMNGQRIDRVDYPGKVQVMTGYAEESNYFDKQSMDNEWFYPETASFVDFDGAVLDGTQGLSNEFKTLGFAQPLDTSVLTPSATTVALKTRFNESFRQRWLRTRGYNSGGTTAAPGRVIGRHDSRQVELWLKLSSIHGFCKNVNKVVRGINFELIMNKNIEYQSIIQCAPFMMPGPVFGANSTLAVPIADAFVGQYQTVINEVSLWMPRLVPTVAIASKLEQELAASAQTKYLFDNMTMYYSDIYTNGSNQRFKVVSEAHRPVLALVGFQYQRQWNQQADSYIGATGQFSALVDNNDQESYGTQRAQNGCSNSSLFSRLGDITLIQCRVNNRIVPAEDYKISFLGGAPNTAESAQRAYYDFKAAYAKLAPWNTSVMDFQTWRDSPIFAFDLSMIGDESIYQGIKTNDVEIRCNITSAGDIAAGFGTGNYQVWCCLFTEVELAVDARQGRITYVP
jgi:hypothetical protein